LEREGKRQRRIEAAKLSTDIATNEFSDARRSLILQVRKAFTAALLAKGSMALAEENGRGFTSRATWPRGASCGRLPSSPTIAGQPLYWIFLR